MHSRNRRVERLSRVPQSANVLVEIAVPAAKISAERRIIYKLLRVEKTLREKRASAKKHTRRIIDELVVICQHSLPIAYAIAFSTLKVQEILRSCKCFQMQLSEIIRGKPRRFSQRDDPPIERRRASCLDCSISPQARPGPINDCLVLRRQHSMTPPRHLPYLPPAPRARRCGVILELTFAPECRSRIQRASPPPILRAGSGNGWRGTGRSGALARLLALPPRVNPLARSHRSAREFRFPPTTRSGTKFMPPDAGTESVVSLRSPGSARSARTRIAPSRRDAC